METEKDGEKRRGKSHERKEKDKRGKTDKSGKTNKRRSQNKSESGNHSRDTSIVPYGNSGKYQNDNEEDKAYNNVGFQGDRTSTSSDWEKLSVDSISL